MLITTTPTRRHLLRLGAALSATSLAGCTETVNRLRGMQTDAQSRTNRTEADNKQSRSRSPNTDSTVGEYRLQAEQATVDVGTDSPYQTWLYDGQFPGPELRLTEGERLRAVVDNQLPDDHPTTTHWHGIPLPNPMDGVPHVTQAPIESGDAFVYEYPVTDPGTYFYHSHVDLQLDRGLYGPLIVEEQSPHVEYDREYTLMFDDYLSSEPAMPAGGMEGMMGHHGNGNHPDVRITTDFS
jgi:FtsP/CotA-like multicopper oxidase with cupredoxin domain